MDLQKLMNAMSEAASKERSNYHLTLGGLVEELRNADPSFVVKFDNELGYPSSPESYRGYYSDLSFPPSDDSITVAELLSFSEKAIGETFEGYKGGDFKMTKDTPLWVSAYGSSSGIAIIGVSQKMDTLYLATKQID